MFYQCRHLFQKLWSNNKSSLGDKNERYSNNNVNTDNLTKKSSVVEEEVGVLEIKPSFGIGNAPRDAKPINKRNLT